MHNPPSPGVDQPPADKQHRLGRRASAKLSRMRGDIVFRVYGVQAGRDKDCYFGAFRSRAEADSEIAKLAARETDGKNWAARYHDQGFVIREHRVATDFEIPSLPAPRARYVVAATPEANAPGTWTRIAVEVFRRGGPAGSSDRQHLCSYARNYSLMQTFEPFRQGQRELALVSRDYTRTAVLDLATGEVIAEEPATTPPGRGFCPVGFYVPDWWDVHDASIIPGSEYWNDGHEWPNGELGFVWGCHWVDDTSWKVQYLDLRRVQEGVIGRDERFGYVALATDGYTSPCLVDAPAADAPARPKFIRVSRGSSGMRAYFEVELEYDLETGALAERD